MGEVVRFPGHRLHKCRGPVDVDWGCVTCEGGLALCEVCGGAEVSLPTHCPGRRMSATVMDLVQDGILDYRGGHWRDLATGMRVVDLC